MFRQASRWRKHSPNKYVSHVIFNALVSTIQHFSGAWGTATTPTVDLRRGSKWMDALWWWHGWLNANELNFYRGGLTPPRRIFTTAESCTFCPELLQHAIMQTIPLKSLVLFYSSFTICKNANLAPFFNPNSNSAAICNWRNCVSILFGI